MLHANNTLCINWWVWVCILWELIRYIRNEHFPLIRSKQRNLSISDTLAYKKKKKRKSTYAISLKISSLYRLLLKNYQIKLKVNVIFSHIEINIKFILMTQKLLKCVLFVVSMFMVLLFVFRTEKINGFYVTRKLCWTIICNRYLLEL